MTGSSSTSRQGSAQKWAKPFAIQGATDTQNTFDQNQPGINSLTSQVQGLVPGLISKYQAGDPDLNAAENYDTTTLAKDPYAGSAQLNNLISSTDADVADQVGAAYGSRGSYGGTAWETALAKGLSGNEDNLRYTDAQNTIANQQAVAQNAPQTAAAGYLGISPVVSAATAGSTIPYTGIAALDQGLSQLFNGGTSTTSTSPLGSILQGVGSVGSSAALGFSDRRLKENIERVGELPDGLGVYDFTYVWGPERHRGVMADEVAELRPWALGPEIAGYATVDYGVL